MSSRERVQPRARLQEQEEFTPGHHSGQILAAEGHKKRGGRHKGVGNKTTGLLKVAILMAAEAVGAFTVEEKEYKVGNKTKTKLVFSKGDGALQGYLEQLAMQEPRSFAALLSRVLPLQIVGKDDGPIEHVYRTSSEVREQLAKRGIPVQSIFNDDPPRPGQRPN